MSVPAGLMAALQQQGGGPSGPPDDQGQDSTDPLQALQEVIQDLHQLVAILPDPQDTSVATQCLLQLTKIQQRLMPQDQQQGPAGALRGRIGAG